MKTKSFILGAFCCLFLSTGYAQRSSSTAGSISPTLPPQDIAYLQSQFVNGMVDFVEAVRPFYQPGDSYAQFKSKVLAGYQSSGGKTTIPILPKEGEGMLFKAYTYLSSGKSAAAIAKEDDGKTIGLAYVFTLEEQQKGRSQIDAQAALFGGDAAALDKSALGKQMRKRCKWWQLWCHLISVVTWVNDHSDEISEAIIAVVSIINMF